MSIENSYQEMIYAAFHSSPASLEKYKACCRSFFKSRAFLDTVAQSSTKVVQLDPARISATAIAEAAMILREGVLVAFPTETVYGLGANALDAAAVARIFEAKGRA